MKKIAIIVFIAFVICFTVLFSSCSEDSEFEVLEVGDESDCCYSSGANHKNEVSLSSNNYRKINSPSAKTVEINGESITLEYMETRETYSYNGEVDHYQYIDSEKGLLTEIGINAETGRMDYYLWWDETYATRMANEERLSQEACEDIAVSYLNQFINSQDYTIVVAEYKASPDYGGRYIFTFNRMKNGMETIDQARITVSIFGDVVNHKFTCLGEMEGTPSLTEGEFNTIENNVDSKVKEIYDPVLDEYTYTYEISEKKIVRFANGDYALRYYINATLTPLDTDEMTLHEGVYLIVYID